MTERLAAAWRGAARARRDTRAARDSTRWWFDRVEDQTSAPESGPPTNAAHPASNTTLGRVLEYYRLRAIP